MRVSIMCASILLLAMIASAEDSKGLVKIYEEYATQKEWHSFGGSGKQECVLTVMKDDPERILVTVRMVGAYRTGRAIDIIGVRGFSDDVQSLIKVVRVYVRFRVVPDTYPKEYAAECKKRGIILPRYLRTTEIWAPYSVAILPRGSIDIDHIAIQLHVKRVDWLPPFDAP